MAGSTLRNVGGKFNICLWVLLSHNLTDSEMHFSTADAKFWEGTWNDQSWEGQWAWNNILGHCSFSDILERQWRIKILNILNLTYNMDWKEWTIEHTAM